MGIGQPHQVHHALNRSVLTRRAVKRVEHDVRPGPGKPLRHVANTPGSTVNVTYRNGRITGRVTQGDSARTLDAEVPAGMFDYSVASVAVRSLPLCEGAAIRVAGYDAVTGPRETVYRILRAEQVEIGGAQRDVWTADVQVGDRTVRTHIDRATGRDLDWSFSGPNGAVLRGVSQIFTTR